MTCFGHLWSFGRPSLNPCTINLKYKLRVPSLNIMSKLTNKQLMILISSLSDVQPTYIHLLHARRCRTLLRSTQFLLPQRQFEARGPQSGLLGRPRYPESCTPHSELRCPNRGWRCSFTKATRPGLNIDCQIIIDNLIWRSAWFSANYTLFRWACTGVMVLWKGIAVLYTRQLLEGYFTLVFLFFVCLSTIILSQWF